MCLKIAVIDGKGGGLGKAICEKITPLTGEDIQLYALGTNASATMAMMKGGASDGATGENAICHMAQQMDIIIGPIAILVANSMMGEISQKMASAVAGSKAEKMLLPLQKCSLTVIGVKDMSINQMLTELEEKIKKLKIK
ncbi:MAG: DUF3842 family protein [Eubacteriales bacterium]